MTRRLRNIFILFVLLGVFIVVAPRFLHLPAFQDEIVNQLSQELSCDVSCAEIRWTWLPFPHVTLREARLDYTSAEITIQEARLYPHWRVLLGDTTRIGRAHFIAPDIRIHTLAGTGVAAFPLALPNTTVTITEGKITYTSPDTIFDAPPESTLPFLKDALTLSQIKASINSHGDRVSVRLQATSPFSRAITIKGNLQPSTLDYSFAVDITDFNLAQLTSELAGGSVAPIDTAFSFKSTIIGNGKEKRLSASVKGTSPSILLKGPAKSFELQGGNMDFSIDVTESRLSTVIRELAVTNPDLALTGTVAYQHPIASKTETPSPQWQINLEGKDLDLGDIRTGLLTLWPNDPTVSEVCSIVRNGKAKTALFRFSGPVEDFSHLGKMYIEVDVANAAIHIPEVDLDLTQGGGPITIVNGVLSGKGLTATMGNSKGRNGSILLGLTPTDHTFILDLDLDIDLAELPPVLNKVVDDEQFLAELALFSSPSGKASGHLNLKDRLDNIFTEISVSSISGNASYDRIPWPLSIQNGTLEIAPDKVRWQGIDTHLGPHLVSGLHGDVSLDDSNIFNATINSATLNGDGLFNELSADNLLPTDFANSVSSLSGTLQIADATFHGPLFSPNKWEYNLSLSTKDLQWTSPFTPEEAPTSSGSAVFKNSEVLIKKSETTLFENILILDGKLNHTDFSNWQGTLRLNGTVSETAYAWLVSQDLLPSSLPFKLPQTLRDMTVAWDGDQTTAKGDVLPESSSDETWAHIDLTVTEDLVNIKKLQLTSAEDQGLLATTFNRAPDQPISLSWEGIVSAATINSLLHTNILSGTMDGSIQSILTSRMDSTWIKGDLTAKNIQWAQSDSSLPQLAIDTLDILGNGPTMALNRLDVRLDEDLITLSGTVVPSSSGMDFDLALHANSIQGNRLLQFWEDAKKNMPETATSRFTGKLNFAVGTFLWEPALPETPQETPPETVESSPEPNTPTPPYIFSPAIGEIILIKGQVPNLNLTSAGLCGLDISGAWSADPETARTYTITTSPTGALFQEVLPCLGFDQDVIEGNFTVKAELLRKNDKWQGKSIDIHSKEGTILRMRFLSKIFKVINITDMFTSKAETSKKGLSYSSLDINTTITDDTLVIDKGVIRGDGLNLFGKGDLNLTTLDADLIILIAPLKTLDSIMAKVPFVGRIIGGENATVVTLPVGVEGNIKDPRVYALPPEAIGDAIVGMIKETVLLPIRILSPILPKEKKEPQPDLETKSPESPE